MALSYLQTLFQYSTGVTGHYGCNPKWLEIYVPQVQTNYGRESLYYQVTMLWNNLSPSLYSVDSIAQFRRSFYDLNINSQLFLFLIRYLFV